MHNTHTMRSGMVPGVQKSRCCAFDRPYAEKYASEGAENGHFRIGYKNIPVSIDDAPKAVQGERNVVTTISARSAQRI